jgi:hypothetical protein
MDSADGMHLHYPQLGDEPPPLSLSRSKLGITVGAPLSQLAACF